jgi:hypothetical protein
VEKGYRWVNIVQILCTQVFKWKKVKTIETIKTVKTIPAMGGGKKKENGGEGEFKYDTL